MVLKFKRDKLTGGYFAHGDQHEYVIYRNTDPVGTHWILRLRKLTVTAGVQHAVGQPDLHVSFEDTLNLGKSVAQAFEDLGEDYKLSEHGGRSRFTEATKVVYGLINAALRAGV